MNKPAQIRQHIRGTALITVMFVLCIATSIAVVMFSRDELNIRRTQNIMNDIQARQYALGGEELARQLLVQDGATFRDKNNLPAPWLHMQDSLRVSHGEVTLIINDMSARFNINILMGGDATQAGRLQKFFELQGIPSNLGKAIVSDLSARKEQVDNITVLRPMPGMTEENYEMVEPYLAALPANGWALNINTASDNVLGAFILDDKIFKILKDMHDKHQTVTELNMRLTGLNDNTLSYISRYFQVIVRAVYSGREVVVTSVMRRDLDPSGSAHIYVISRDTSKTF